MAYVLWSCLNDINNHFHVMVPAMNWPIGMVITVINLKKLYKKMTLKYLTKSPSSGRFTLIGSVHGLDMTHGYRLTLDEGKGFPCFALTDFSPRNSRYASSWARFCVNTWYDRPWIFHLLTGTRHLLHTGHETRMLLGMTAITRLISDWIQELLRH